MTCRNGQIMIREAAADRIRKERKMDRNLQHKYDILQGKLKEIPGLAVAFSGGVDSAFLLYAAHQALNDQVIALTARMVSVGEDENRAVVSFCEQYQIRQFFLDVDVLGIEGYAQNPKNRCYLCKKEIFGRIIQAAQEYGVHVVAEGSNLDDQSVYRPGLRAIRELGVISPLQEAGLKKSEIRSLSREFGLKTWDKPSLSCLATRFPYGEQLTEEKFSRVASAEKMLRDFGFSQIRVRVHGSMARIELLPEEFGKLLDEKTREEILAQFSSLGFLCVTLDLKGFRSGSMDELSRERIYRPVDEIPNR